MRILNKAWLITYNQSAQPTYQPSSYNQIHVASNPVYLLHNIIIISIRLARPLISADTSNNDGNSFAKMLHRFAKLTEIDLGTPFVLATVWCCSVITSNLVSSPLVKTASTYLLGAICCDRHCVQESLTQPQTKDQLRAQNVRSSFYVLWQWHALYIVPITVLQ